MGLSQKKHLKKNLSMQNVHEVQVMLENLGNSRPSAPTVVDENENDGGDVTLMSVDANENPEMVSNEEASSLQPSTIGFLQSVPIDASNDTLNDGESAPKAAYVTMAKKAGLVFNPTRVNKALKKGNYAKKIRVASAIYMAGVLEYLVAEILEIAGDAAHDNHRKRIGVRHVNQAIRMDDEIGALLRKVTIAGGGVMPYIHPVLLKNQNPLRLSQAKFKKVMTKGKARKVKEPEQSNANSTAVEPSENAANALNVSLPKKIYGMRRKSSAEGSPLELQTIQNALLAEQLRVPSDTSVVSIEF